MKSFTLWKAGMLCLFSLFFVLVSCNKESQEEYSELQRVIVEQNDCFFTNQCLIEGNENIIKSIDAVAPVNDAFINSLKNYFKETEQQSFITFIKRNHGTPFWQGGKILDKEEDGSQIGLIPIFKDNSEIVETIMLVNLDKSKENPKFNFIDRVNIDKYKEKEGGDIAYDVALLSFLNLDKKVFGKTSTDFLSRYHSFEKSLRSTDSEVAVARDGICYAVLYEVTTSWYQYNPATGTLTFLSNTYSYQWQDLCLDEGIDPWAPGGNSGGTPDDDDDDDDDDGAPCSNGDCDDDLALLIKWPAIKKTSNGTYLYAPTCSSSFKLKTVGNSYTMQVNKIWHAYIGGRDKFFGEYKIGSMCINVWRYKPGGGGVRSIIDTQNGLATAFDEARVETIQDWERGWISESELKSRFIARLTGQISGEFGISLGQVTVNPTPCKNIPSQPLLLKPFSSCKTIGSNEF